MARNLTNGLQRGLRRSISGGFGAGDIFTIAPLDLRFAQQKTLDSRITFTRASSGTYVGSDGLIKTATTNLLLRSEEFGTWWTPLRASVSSNAAVAPNGQLTADKLVEDTTASNSHAVYSGGTQGAGTYTISVYAKAAERSRLFIAQESGGNSLFTLSGAGTASATGANTVSITNVGDGWYRCTSTYTATGAHFIYLQTHNGTSNIYTGDGTSGLFIWGAQLEQSSTVGEYIPTTSTINSAPRFDHNPTTGESLGLLVEEQRTNFLVRSEELSNTTWTGSSLGVTVTANTNASPDGLTTADRLQGTSGSYFQQIYTTASGANVSYTFSIYLRSNTGSNQTLRLKNTHAGIIDKFSDNLTVTPSWQRFSFTVTNGGSAGTGQIPGIVPDTTGNSYDVLAWGAQLEAGSFPTSYIPTTSATVTRSADVASITGANFSSWYRQDEGTVFANFRARNGSRLFMFDDGTTNERWEGRWLNGTFQLNNWSAGVATISGGFSGSGFSDLQDIKGVHANKTNDAATSTNGVAPDAGTGGIDNSTTIAASQSRLFIGSFQGTATYVNGTIRRLTYWPFRLPNSTLQGITR